MTGHAPAPKSSRDRAHVLSGLIALRVVCGALVWYHLLHDLRAWALGIFLFACLTDAIDGHLASAWNAPPSLGPYADPIADVVLVIASFSAFVVQGIYPLWTLLLIGAMFLQFVWTSGWKAPVYDPVGKYYGLLLFAAVGITLVCPSTAVRRAVLVGLPTFTAVSLASRIVFLLYPARGSSKPRGRSGD